MSESNCATEEKRDPVEEEVKAGTSRDNGEKKKTSSRKRKASTDDPPELSDEVKAKLKVKLSGSKSSKKKSKKSSKEKKNKKKSKERSPKRKKSSRKTTAQLLPDANAQSHVPADIFQIESTEARSELPEQIQQVVNVEVPSEPPEQIQQAVNLEAHSNLFSDNLQFKNFKDSAQVPAEILQPPSIICCTELSEEVSPVSSFKTSTELPSEVPQPDRVEIHNPSEPPEQVLQAANVQVHSEFFTETLYNDKFKASTNIPTEILQPSSIETCSELIEEALQSAKFKTSAEPAVEVLHSDNTVIHNSSEIPPELLETTHIEIHNSSKLSTEVLQTNSVELHDPSELPAEVLMSVMVEVHNELPEEVLQVVSVKDHNEPAEVSTSAIVDFYNEINAKILKDMNIEIQSQPGKSLQAPTVEDSNCLQDSTQNNTIHQSLQYITYKEDKKQNEDSDHESCAATVIMSDTESNSPRNNQTECSTEVLLDFNSKLQPIFSVPDFEKNIIHDSLKEYENEKVSEDQNEVVDIHQINSNNTIVERNLILTESTEYEETNQNQGEEMDSNNERNFVETEDTVMNEDSQEPVLRAIAIETTNVNQNFSKKEGNEDLIKDLNETMDTSVIANKSLRSNSDNEKNVIEAEDTIINENLLDFDSQKEPRAITIETTNTNQNFSKEGENKDLIKDLNEAIDTYETASKSLISNLHNEKNLIVVEDTIINEDLLGFDNQKEPVLRTLTIELTNVNSMEHQECKETKQNENEDEEMDTCEDFYHYKKICVAVDTNLTNTNTERSIENISKEINHDQNIKKRTLKNSGVIEERQPTIESTEADPETVNRQINEEISNEQNNVTDLSNSKKKKSTSKRKKSSKSKASKSKSLKSSSSKSVNSTSSNSSRSTSKKSRTVIRSPHRHYNINEKDDISCRICEQALNSELKFYSGNPENSHDEELAILDSRLLLFNGDEENVSREDTRAYNKLTSYSVYCENGHLCPFDSGLIERDVKIYFSGYVKPIYTEDSSTKNGVPGKDFGPIVEWWTTGFDVGEQPTVAFSTEIGDYVLMEPSDEYKPFMQSVLVKILISKIVIEYLVYEPYATFEDLLNKLQNAAMIYDSLPNMTEDVLLQYAPFICMQVMSYDETAKPNEPLMLVAPCIRRLIDLTGISFKADTAISSRQQHNYHERRAGDYRKELLRKIAENRGDHSFTSQLIDSLLPTVENKLIALSKPCTRSPCGSCDRCLRDSCKECEACQQKNYENCPRRRCFFREIQEANDEDAEDSIDLSQLKGKSSINAFKDTINTFSCFSAKLSWVGDPIKIDDNGDTFYAAVKHNYDTICAGDFVFVRSVDLSVPPQVVKVSCLWEDNAGLAFFHAKLYWWGKDTVLGELARPNEVFSINRCNKMSVNCITNKVNVEEKSVPRNQNQETKVINFFCEKSYEPSTGCFHDLPTNEEAPILPDSRSCIDCEGKINRSQREEPRAIDKLKEENKRTLYRAIKYKDEEYIVGSCVYLKPKSLYFQFPMLFDQRGKSSGKIIKKMDEEKYPEFYRKAEDKIMDSKFDMPAPYDIGQITEIFKADKLYVKIKKLYRPENTHRGEILVQQNDMNMLYWSNEVCTVAFSYVIRKCYVAYLKDLHKSVEEWSNLGPDRFYVSQMYCDKKFTNIDRNMFGCKDASWECELPIDYPHVDAMVSLEIFSGCGGLTLGLRDSGIISKYGWAIEIDVDAANTFKMNNPDVKVLVEHPDVVLRKVIKDEHHLNGITLPHKGDIQLLSATLPCENYKDMTDISVFKHSSIATFLSYCDHYKPLLFILEADEKFIKRSVVLKLTLACFVSMGYQVTFDLMQVGSYGAPQNRRRSVVLGAAPGQQLPKFPERLHVFPKSLCQLGIVIDSKKYTQDTFWTESAPYRSVTVRDALLDLPVIKVGNNEDLNYDAKSASYFAKTMRINMLEPTVFNHVCKDLGPLVESRITQIPLAVGSDWRNLPNIEVQLRDASFAKKIEYNYDDVEAGKSLNGALRGVCACASGGKCNPRDRQHGCLIPWHLVHSARQNKHWAGIYSRLQWDGFFNGAITNPQPLGTQGFVIHPTQSRTVSVRECARAQGFPDDFVLPKNVSIHDMYRIIGRTSSPFLGRAIGHEIARSLASRHHK